MKTNMFKKMSKEEKKNKFIRIMKKRTNQKITDDMIKTVMKSIDMDNQYKINFYDRARKFADACIANEIIYDYDSIVEREIETINVLYGDIEIDRDNVIFNTSTNQVLLKVVNRIYKNDTTEWFYSLEIYVPEK